MELKDYNITGPIISIDSNNTIIKDDAILIDILPNGNYCVDLYVANPCATVNVANLLDDCIKNKYSKYGNNCDGKKVKSTCLSESEPRDVIAYRLEIDQEGNFKNIDIRKDKVTIDVALTETEVAELIDDEGRITDYLYELYALNDKLYNNRTKKDPDSRYNEIDKGIFGLYAINEVVALVNVVVAEMFYSNNWPCIYDVKELGKDYYNYYYYTSEPIINAKYGSLLGAFTSPLQDVADLKNIEIINDLVLKDYDTDEEKRVIIEGHKQHIKGYRADKNYSYNGGDKIEYIRL